MSLPDYYDMLDISLNATNSDIIEAYKLAINAYSSGSQATYSLFDEEQLQSIRNEIDQAYKTLIHTEKRRTYDEMLQQTNKTDMAENVYYLKFPEGSENNKTAFLHSGAQLRKIRKSRSISLQRIESSTGVSCRILQAIEDENSAILPEPIELEQALRLYATEIKLNPDAVCNSYPPLEQRAAG